VVAVRQHLEQTTEFLGLTQFSVPSHQLAVVLAHEKVEDQLEQVDQVVV
jgi:hypothetical protein|tara:strand:+ start:723 stop:869 length:147 start_codon:yes stop_codon:yes gene_type:complete